MATYEFGFIGTGHMGSALAYAAAQTVEPERIVLANRTPAKAQALAKEIGCACAGNGEATAQSRFIVLGVKPQMMEDLLGKLASVLAARTDRFVLVSMAAGVTMEQICRMAGGNYPVIRLMPNTPVVVGEGMTLYTANSLVTPDELVDFLDDIAAAGRFEALEEPLFDAAGAVSGCGPAFAFLFLEALADGAVACGVPRAKATVFAAQMLLGAAHLALEGDEHTAVLKDAVCSPGGSTIAGVRALENAAFRGAVMDAVIASCQRTRELGKPKK